MTSRLEQLLSLNALRKLDKILFFSIQIWKTSFYELFYIKKKSDKCIQNSSIR